MESELWPNLIVETHRREVGALSASLAVAMDWADELVTGVQFTFVRSENPMKYLYPPPTPHLCVPNRFP